MLLRSLTVCWHQLVRTLSTACFGWLLRKSITRLHTYKQPSTLLQLFSMCVSYSNRNSVASSPCPPSLSTLHAERWNTDSWKGLRTKLVNIFCQSFLKLKAINLDHLLVIHTLLLLVQATSLSVAINSYNNVLITIMVSNNFVELKGSVFKKFETNNLFQMACSGRVIWLWHDKINNTAMIWQILERDFIMLSCWELCLLETWSSLTGMQVCKPVHQYKQNFSICVH